MVTHRIKYKIGEKEFEIEGEKDFVEQWFKKLKKELMKPKPVFQFQRILILFVFSFEFLTDLFFSLTSKFDFIHQCLPFLPIQLNDFES